jgi:hypothetical protein
METDKTVTFDYLRPDFSILKGRKFVFVDLQPEYQFYLKHRIIHWLNSINNSYDSSLNFDAIKLDRHMVGSSKAVIANYGLWNRAGSITMEYTKQGEFESFNFTATESVFRNEAHFPSSSQYFSIDADMDETDNLKKYTLQRIFDLEGEKSFDDVIIRYFFDKNCEKYNEYIMFYQGDELELSRYNNDRPEDRLFDGFFNHNVYDIFNAINTFLELYPQFEMNCINKNTDFSIFYDKLRQFYNEGLFDNKFEENINVLKMMSI